MFGFMSWLSTAARRPGGPAADETRSPAQVRGARGALGGYRHAAREWLDEDPEHRFGEADLDDGNDPDAPRAGS